PAARAVHAPRSALAAVSRPGGRRQRTTMPLTDKPTRRDFAKASAGALLAAGAPSRIAGAAPAGKRRYAIVGVGSRAYLYLDAIQTAHADKVELVGACDVNAGRLELARAHARNAKRAEPRAYPAADFDRMIAETKPDAVIVPSVAGTHAAYISRSVARRRRAAGGGGWSRTSSRRSR